MLFNVDKLYLFPVAITNKHDIEWRTWKVTPDGSGITPKHLIKVEKPPRDKYTYLWQTFVNYKSNNVYTIETRGLYYKTLCIRNLLYFIVS